MSGIILVFYTIKFTCTNGLKAHASLKNIGNNRKPLPVSWKVCRLNPATRHTNIETSRKKKQTKSIHFHGAPQLAQCLYGVDMSIQLLPQLLHYYQYKITTKGQIVWIYKQENGPYANHQRANSYHV